MKVKAKFPDGDELILTVEKLISNVDLYYFSEKNICAWWWKDLCEIVEE